MEVVAQIQSLVQEHAFFIGVGLLVLVAAVAVAWFWMSRGSGSSEEGKVLVNQARVNEADMGEGTPMIPPSAMGAPPSSPVMMDAEEAERQRAEMTAQAANAE
jgi:hypothetical protein